MRSRSIGCNVLISLLDFKVHSDEGVIGEISVVVSDDIQV